MITPRRTRLVRVPDLQSFRRAIRTLAEGDGVESRFVVVPNRGAAVEIAGPPGSRVPPSVFLTREELYEQLHARMASRPQWLTPFEREAIAQSAAAEAARVVRDLTFHIRPGLVAEMLRFYDHLRRQSQPAVRFQQLMEEALGADAPGLDRGAERMLRQTDFLARAFAIYENRVEACGACDEHQLRGRLILEGVAPPVRHIVVTVSDWIAEPSGLFVADFDMLTRIPGIEAIDVVSTAAQLEAGFQQRLHDWLPGIEEVDGRGFAGNGSSVRPALLVPPNVPADQLWFAYRDREEELIAAASAYDERRGRIGIVYKRPLPYLYPAPAVFASAGIRHSSPDALPLAAEPTAAAVDLVLDAVETGFAREPLVALLRSPHFRFTIDGLETPAAAVGALNRFLSGQRYLGDRLKLEALGERAGPDPVLPLVIAITRELAPMAEAAPASVQVHRLHGFLENWFRALSSDPTDAFAIRERGARAAIGDVLNHLADAHARHHDPQWTAADLATAVRRWIQEKTFAVDDERDGARLLDDQAARYGDFDDVFIVGLTENEWPERHQRNIFYPPSLLKALGWPSERDRRAAADAALLDLVASASRSVTLSTFKLDDEMLVTRSIQLDEIARARLSAVAYAPELKLGPTDKRRVGPSTPGVGPSTPGVGPSTPGVGPSTPRVGPSTPRVGPSTPRVGPSFSSGEASGTAGREGGSSGADAWAALRRARPSKDAPEFHGQTGRQHSPVWSVSALETYLDCPFKFFARHVLELEEEPEDEEVMDPRHQGQLVHAVFEAFFTEWQKAGHGAITARNLDQAREMFAAVVDRMLEPIPPAEAALERTRLLGSPAASGLGEAVFRMEAERPIAVVERLLEYRLDGNVVLDPDRGAAVTLRGKADRIDLLADGTFRLIDYKLGWPPDRGRALQLPIYALSADRKLQQYRGRQWTLGEAAYLAFKGPKRVVPLFTSPAQRVEVLAAAERRVADTLGAIDRGEFPPAPDDVFRCEMCAFGAVCRRDYVVS